MLINSLIERCVLFLFEPGGGHSVDVNSLAGDDNVPSELEEEDDSF